MQDPEKRHILYYVKFGKYEASLTDKSFLGLSTELEYRQYFINFRVLVYFRNLQTLESRTLKVSATDLFPLKKKGENKYRIHKKKAQKSFESWLFNLLRNKKITIIEYPQLKLDNPYNLDLKKYYLKSAIGDRNVIVSDKPIEHKIESLDDRLWLLENGFYDSAIEWRFRKDA